MASSTPVKGQDQRLLEQKVILPVCQLTDQQLTATRVAVIPFEYTDQLYLYLGSTRSGMLSTIGGGVDENDNNWVETLKREYHEELNQQLPLRLALIHQCWAVNRGSSLTIMVPVDIFQKRKIFERTTEIRSLHRLTKHQFFYLTNRVNHKNEERKYHIKFTPGKFVADLLNWDEIEVVTNLNRQYRSEDFQLIPFPPRTELDLEGIFNKLENDPFFFHGRIVVTADPDMWYLGYHYDKICPMKPTPENITRLSQLSVDHRGNSIIYSLKNEPITGVKARNLMRWTGNNDLSTQYFTVDYPKFFEQGVSGDQRCLFLIEKENEIYQTKQRRFRDFSCEQRIINWILERNQHNGRLTKEENLRFESIVERFKVSSRDYYQVIRFLVDAELIEPRRRTL